MLDSFTIGNAETKDILNIATFHHCMVEEMEKNGGYLGSEDHKEWEYLQETIHRNMKNENLIYKVAEPIKQNNNIIGFSEARIIDRTFVFRPSRILHIHSLFVDSSYRGKGVGGSLLESTMQWGRERKCEEVELSVLVKNSARTLYGRLGFRPFELELTRNS